MIPPSVDCIPRRELKSEVTLTHNNVYGGDKLLQETITGDGTEKALDFQYDNAGMPYALIYNDGTQTTTYYYVTNLQGDVTYLVDSNGDVRASYTYDPYGKPINLDGMMADINPLRYRGYYYDAETGFYYLQSRYYDPQVGRFISADEFASTGQGILGTNMFAYCLNNPICCGDSSGGRAVALADADSGDSSLIIPEVSPVCHIYFYTYGDLEMTSRDGLSISFETVSKVGHVYFYSGSAEQMPQMVFDVIRIFWLEI